MTKQPSRWLTGAKGTCQPRNGPGDSDLGWVDATLLTGFVEDLVVLFGRVQLPVEEKYVQLKAELWPSWCSLILVICLQVFPYPTK